MLGLNEAIRRTVRNLLRSPIPLLHGTGSMLGSPSASSFQSESELSSGLSLARNDRPSQARHSEVVVPDLLFQFPPIFRRARSASAALTSRFPVSRRPHSARCPISNRRLSLCAEPPLPFGGFYAPRDRSVQSSPQSDDPPSRDARFPFAPRRRYFLWLRLRINVPGSLHPAWLTVPLNLLEPST